MKNFTWKRILGFVLSIFIITQYGIARQTETADSSYRLTDSKIIPATSVKHQGETGTCWCFATLSFIESELLRMGKDSLDLSEMFVVRHLWPDKARNYIRLHGRTVFSCGSLAHDALRMMQEHGIVPEAVFPGKYADGPVHDHQEMDAVLTAFVEAIVKNPGGKLSQAWPSAFEGMLNAYLGVPPERFTFRKKSYTPKSFFAELGIDPGNYIQFTSFTHQPFYSRFRLEVPDNWSGGTFYNLPLDELVLLIEQALANGYSLCWDGDVSEKSFKSKLGVAIVPEKDWQDRTESEKENIGRIIEPEKKVTPALRQEWFDNYASGDDHLMHLVGLAQDQTGAKFYRMKDSFGSKDRKHQGFIYLSEAYLRAKTMSVMVHKAAVPRDLAVKLAITR